MTRGRVNDDGVANHYIDWERRGLVQDNRQEYNKFQEHGIFYLGSRFNMGNGRTTTGGEQICWQDPIFWCNLVWYHAFAQEKIRKNDEESCVFTLVFLKGEKFAQFLVVFLPELSQSFA